MTRAFDLAAAPRSTGPTLGRQRLTTAEILYRLPDHPDLLQTFTWQCMDRAPDYPRLTRFLDYWAHHLDGALHSVRVMQAGHRRGIRAVDAWLDLPAGPGPRSKPH